MYEGDFAIISKNKKSCIHVNYVKPENETNFLIKIYYTILSFEIYQIKSEEK